MMIIKQYPDTYGFDVEAIATATRPTIVSSGFWKLNG
jgi:hypothetical protein